MAEKRFDVLTKFRAHTGALDAAVIRSTRYIARMGDRVTRVVGSVARIGTSALGIAGIGGLGYAAYRTTRTMIELNRETESSRIGIATMLQQASHGGRGPFGDFNRALGEATKLQREFEVRGAKLPGTTDDFRRSFELLLPTLAKTGAGIEDVLGLSERVVVAAKVGNVYGGTETVARDINQILAGRVNEREISTGALRDPAKQIAEMARKDRAEAVRMINKALQVSPAALAEFERSFDARSSTFEDNIKRFLRSAGGPVFEWVNEKLGGWNNWLERNADKVKEIAKEVGSRIVTGIQDVAEWTEKAAGWASGFADNFKRAYDWVSKIPDKLAEIAKETPVGAVEKEIDRVNQVLESARTMTGKITGDVVRSRILGSVAPGSGINMEHQEWGVYKRGIEAHFRSRGNGILADKFRGDPFGTLRGDGIDSAPDIPDGVLTALAKQASKFIAKDMGQGSNIVDRVLDRVGNGGFQAPPSSIATTQKKAVDEYRRRLGQSDKEIEAEALARFKKQSPTVSIDARGSTFRIEQNLPDGDPDRVAIAVRQGIMKPFVPVLASFSGPRL